MSEKYKDYKVKELQERLKEVDLPHTGKKEELIARLVKHDEEEEAMLNYPLGEDISNLEDFGGEFDDIDLETDLLSAEPKDEKQDKTKTSGSSKEKLAAKAAAATIAKPVQKVAAVPTKKTSPPSKPTSTSTPTVPKANITTPTKPPALASSPSDATKPISKSGTTMTEAEKRAERAKRFGVQLKEEDKQNLRAQRFSIPQPATKNTPKKTLAPTTVEKQPPKSPIKGLDPKVLEKRAERFGLPVKTDKINKASPLFKLDAAEEEKKRKRAERFATDANKKQKPTE